MESSLTRRNVLTTIIATAGAAAVGGSAVANVPAEKATVSPEYYELRALRLRRGPMASRVDLYLKDAFIPAARRAGCGPVGAFNVMIGQGNPSTYVLISHPSLESFATLTQKLADDAEYKLASADFRGLPATDPPYVNLEVTLLRAFPHFPKLEPTELKPRIFELRTYRSHNHAAGLKKIEMFDTGGEIAIFRRVGLTPVFFSQTLTGSHLPSLTYMLTYPDLATREASWNAFRKDAEWKKLSTTPGYTDAEIVVDIDNQILAPTSYSQV